MRTTETLAAWILALVVIVGMGLTLGCGASITKNGLLVVVGDSSIGAGCEGGDMTKCEDMARGAEMSVGLVGLIKKMIDTAVMIAGHFVPGGLDAGDGNERPDHITNITVTPEGASEEPADDSVSVYVPGVDPWAITPDGIITLEIAPDWVVWDPAD